MKPFLLFVLPVLIALTACSNDEKDGSTIENSIVWNGVFFDTELNTDSHDPRFNYVLIVDGSNNLEVYPPAQGVEEKITKIEMLNEKEMSLTWQIGTDSRVVKTTFNFQNENELIIDRFIYTLAAVPFPSNLTQGKFIREPKKP